MGLSHRKVDQVKCNGQQKSPIRPHVPTVVLTIRATMLSKMLAQRIRRTASDSCRTKTSIFSIPVATSRQLARAKSHLRVNAYVASKSKQPLFSQSAGILPTASRAAAKLSSGISGRNGSPSRVLQGG